MEKLYFINFPQLCYRQSIFQVIVILIPSVNGIDNYNYGLSNISEGTMDGKHSEWIYKILAVPAKIILMIKTK